LTEFLNESGGSQGMKARDIQMQPEIFREKLVSIQLPMLSLLSRWFTSGFQDNYPVHTEKWIGRTIQKWTDSALRSVQIRL
jgi:hypothetical protein